MRNSSCLLVGGSASENSQYARRLKRSCPAAAVFGLLPGNKWKGTQILELVIAVDANAPTDETMRDSAKKILNHDLDRPPSFLGEYRDDVGVFGHCLI